MSWPFDLSHGPNLDAAIDRLVLDELSPTDRQALLLALEASPEGWRRCALAFLEDQAWRTALAAPFLERERPGNDPLAGTPSKPRPKLQQSIPLASIAAVFAMGCGLAFLAGTRIGRDDPAVVIARRSLSADAKLAEPSTRPGEPIGWVALVDPSDADARPRSVPLLAATAANEQWLREQPAAMPDYVRAQWERRGFVVQESRHLVDLGLQDGQPVVIPVDEVELDYVGRQPL